MTLKTYKKEANITTGEGKRRMMAFKRRKRE